MTAGVAAVGPARAPAEEARTTPLQDVATVFLREVRPVLLAPWALAFTLVQPLIMLVLFAPLLVADAAWVAPAGPGAGSPGGALAWFLPAVLVMIVVFATSGVGEALLAEQRSGAHERLLVTPMRRSALIVGRALKELVTVVAQAVLIVLVALPFGVRPHIGGLMLGLVLLGVLGVGVAAFSYSLVLLVRNQDWIFWMVQQTLMFPLLILSGLLLPLESAPRWMVVVAEANPLAHVAQALRSLTAGVFDPAEIAAAAVAGGVTVTLGLALGVRLMRRAGG